MCTCIYVCVCVCVCDIKKTHRGEVGRDPTPVGGVPPLVILYVTFLESFDIEVYATTECVCVCV